MSVGVVPFVAKTPVGAAGVADDKSRRSSSGSMAQQAREIDWTAGETDWRARLPTPRILRDGIAAITREGSQHK